ncbi:yemanuclein isoform X2 [Aethina tumida]|uniref:yemanuclein isoform X2 n=1 Tax=Aethina tumida TaxID=116153 RepID=UPI00214955C6|nr:yemanuclein isoform X2 [Aethina tumida]
MSDNKRLALTTLEPQKVSDKQNKKPAKTIRISVILPESNEDNCPEFNYKEQLAAAKKRAKLKEKKEPNAENGLDPFADDDDDVRRIAMQFEEKYGGTGANKKKRKGRKDDYADIGMGYDESDSFIDNTDGYDEIIPQNVTTLLGGFYINCGALEFKTDDEATSELSSSSSDSDNDNEDNKSSTSRKRALSTSDEDEEDENGSQAEKKQKVEDKNNMQQAIKKKLFNQNKIQVKKRRPIDPVKKTVKELLREKRQDLNMSVPQDLITDGEVVEERESHKENKKPMSISSVADAIESVVKANLPQKSDFDNNANNRSLDVNPSIRNDVSLTFEGESSHDANVEKTEAVKLPENLSADILEVINSIKQAALEHKDGKVKFFNEEVNSKLLSLEKKCKCLGKASKSKVFEHLSAFVACTKETLMKRAKNLLFEEEQKTLKRMINKLKYGIEQIMPALLLNHEKESQKVLQRKFSQDSATNEENKSLRMPHRKFQWNEDLKKLLKDIISTKKRCLTHEGKPKDSLDELILQYFRTDIKLLWPDGWMSEAALRKASGIDIPPKKLDDSMNKSQDHVKNTSLNKSMDIKNNMNNDLSKHSQKGPSLTLNNSNLQIIPVTGNNVVKSTSSKTESITSDITVSKISNNNVKPSQKLPDKSLTITKSFKKEDEKKDRGEHQFFDLSNTIKVPETSVQPVLLDNSVIVSTHKKEETHIRLPEEKKEMKTVISESKHCPVIDLTDHHNKKKSVTKVKLPKPVDYTKVSESGMFASDVPTDFSTKPKVADYAATKAEILPIPMEFKDPMMLSNRHPDLSIVPNYQHPAPPKEPVNQDGDDIQKVLENLRTLQQMSSPSKSSDNSHSNSVPVIAYNKSFSPKNTNTATNHNNECKSASEFQEDFQKQFISQVTHMSSPQSSKQNYNRCS